MSTAISAGRGAAPVIVREWRVTGEQDPPFNDYSFTWPRPGAESAGEDPLDGEAAARHFLRNMVKVADDGTLLGRMRNLTLSHRTVTYEDWVTAALLPGTPSS